MNPAVGTQVSAEKWKECGASKSPVDVVWFHAACTGKHTVNVTEAVHWPLSEVGLGHERGSVPASARVVFTCTEGHIQ